MADLLPLTIAYYDNDGIWPSIAPQIQSRIPLNSVKLNMRTANSNSPSNTVAIVNNLDVQFIPHDDSRVRLPLAQFDSQAIADRPYLYINFVKDSEAKHKNNHLKKHLKSWAEGFSERNEEWIIVYVVERTENDNFSKRVKKALDNVKGYVSQASSKKKDRVIRVIVDTYDSEGNVISASDLWEEFFNMVKEYLENSIEMRYNTLEKEQKFETISMNDQYFQIFLAKEGLARLHYKCSRYQDALALYESLDIFRHYEYTNKKVKPMFKEFGFTEASAESPTLFEISYKEYYKSFMDGTIPYFDLKQYIFSRQLSLLVELDAYTKLGKFALQFVTRLTAELSSFVSPVRANIWGFLASVQLGFYLLAKCSNLNDALDTEPFEDKVVPFKTDKGEKTQKQSTLKSTKYPMSFASKKADMSRGKYFISKGMQSFALNFNLLNAASSRDSLLDSKATGDKLGKGVKKSSGKLMQSSETTDAEEQMVAAKRYAALLIIFAVKQLIHLGHWRQQNSWSEIMDSTSSASPRSKGLVSGFDSPVSSFEVSAYFSRSLLMESLKDFNSFTELLINCMTVALQQHMDIGSVRHATVLQLHIVQHLIKLESYQNCSGILNRILASLSVEPWTKLWVECKKMQFTVSMLTNRTVEALHCSYMLSNAYAGCYLPMETLKTTSEKQTTVPSKSSTQNPLDSVPTPVPDSSEAYFQHFVRLSKKNDINDESDMDAHSNITLGTTNGVNHLEMRAEAEKDAPLDIRTQPSKITKDPITTVVNSRPSILQGSNKVHLTCEPNLYCWVFPLSLYEKPILAEQPPVMTFQSYQEETTSDKSPQPLATEPESTTVGNTVTAKSQTPSPYPASFLLPFFTKEKSPAGPKNSEAANGYAAPFSKSNRKARNSSKKHNPPTSRSIPFQKLIGDRFLRDYRSKKKSQDTQSSALPKKGSMKGGTRGFIWASANSRSSQSESNKIALEKAILKQLHQPTPLLILPCSPQTLNAAILKGYFTRLQEVLPKTGVQKSNNKTNFVETRFQEEEVSKRATGDTIEKHLFGTTTYESNSELESVEENLFKPSPRARSRYFATSNSNRHPYRIAMLEESSGKVALEGSETISLSLLSHVHKNAVYNVESLLQSHTTRHEYGNYTPLSIGEKFSIQLGIQSILPSSLVLDRIVLKVSKLSFKQALVGGNRRADECCWLICEGNSNYIVPSEAAFSDSSVEKPMAIQTLRNTTNDAITVHSGLNIFNIIWSCTTVGYYLIDQIILVVGSSLLSQNFEDFPSPGLFDVVSQSMGLMSQINASIRQRKKFDLGNRVDSCYPDASSKDKNSDASMSCDDKRMEKSNRLKQPYAPLDAYFMCYRYNPLDYIEEPPIMDIKPMERDVEVLIKKSAVLNNNNPLPNKERGTPDLMLYWGTVNMLRISVSISPTFINSTRFSLCLGNSDILQDASELTDSEKIGLASHKMIEGQSHAAHFLDYVFGYSEARIIEIDGEQVCVGVDILDEEDISEQLSSDTTSTAFVKPTMDTTNVRSPLLFLQLPFFKKNCDLIIPLFIKPPETSQTAENMAVSNLILASVDDTVKKRSIKLSTVLKACVHWDSEGTHMEEYRWIKNFYTEANVRSLNPPGFPLARFQSHEMLLPKEATPYQTKQQSAFADNQSKETVLLKSASFELGIFEPLSFTSKFRRLNHNKCVIEILMKCHCEELMLVKATISAKQSNSEHLNADQQIRGKFAVFSPVWRSTDGVTREDGNVQQISEEEVIFNAKMVQGSYFSFLITSDIDFTTNASALRNMYSFFDFAIDIVYTLPNSAKSEYRAETLHTISFDNFKTLTSSTMLHKILLRDIPLHCPIAVEYNLPVQGRAYSPIPSSIIIKNLSEETVLLRCQLQIKENCLEEFFSPTDDTDTARLKAQLSHTKVANTLENKESGSSQGPLWIVMGPVCRIFELSPGCSYSMSFNLIPLKTGSYCVPFVILAIADYHNLAAKHDDVADAESLLVSNRSHAKLTPGDSQEPSSPKSIFTNFQTVSYDPSVTDAADRINAAAVLPHTEVKACRTEGIGRVTDAEVLEDMATSEHSFASQDTHISNYAQASPHKIAGDKLFFSAQTAESSRTIIDTVKLVGGSDSKHALKQLTWKRLTYWDPVLLNRDVYIGKNKFQSDSVIKKS